MFPKMGLLFKKAVQNLMADFWLNIVTVLVIALSIMLVGSFTIFVTNASKLVDQFAGRVQVMIYLKDPHTPAQVETLKKDVTADPAVESCTYISKAEALSRFKSQLAELKDVADAMDENPLPASLEVTLHSQYMDLPNLDSFAEKWSQRPGVEEVYFGKEWVERLGRIVRILWASGIGVGIFLTGTAVFIIATTIRLAIHRRRDEIGIMRLVGATNRFIQMPFIFEGIMQGLCGAILAVGLMYGAYLFTAGRLAGGTDLMIPFFPGFSFHFLSIHAMGTLVLSGAIVGLFGSLVSIGKFLKV